MLDIPFFEFGLIAIIVFLILGPDDFVKLCKQLGALYREFKRLWEQAQGQPQKIKTSTQSLNPSEYSLAPCVHVALFQPEIPHNTGSMLRLSACLAVPVHIIEPCGFIWSDRHLKRSGMDYVDTAMYWRHVDWNAFRESTKGQRIISLSTEAKAAYTDFVFEPHDILLLGQESPGLPDYVKDLCDHSLIIPMRPPCRSLNLSLSATLVVGEALRQLRYKV